jgi:hypothetical protein
MSGVASETMPAVLASIGFQRVIDLTTPAFGPAPRAFASNGWSRPGAQPDDMTAEKLPKRT